LKTDIKGQLSTGCFSTQRLLEDSASKQFVQYLRTKRCQSAPADPLLQHLPILLLERHPQDLGIGGSVDHLQPLVACGAFGIWDEPTHHQNLWHNLQALLVDSFAHLLFQRSHLIQNIHNLQEQLNESATASWTLSNCQY